MLLLLLQSVAVDLRNLANCDPPAESVIQSVLSELFVGAPSPARDSQKRCKMLDLLAAVPVSDEPPGPEPPLLHTVLPTYGALRAQWPSNLVCQREAVHPASCSLARDTAPSPPTPCSASRAFLDLQSKS